MDQFGRLHKRSRTVDFAVDEERRSIDLAYCWWNDHLKPSNWIEFKPKEKYCENSGFVPVQYTEVIESFVSSDKKLSRKKIVDHVLEHGERGKHYAIGWLELSDLLRKYGTCRSDTEGLRPGARNYKILVSYQGPPLVFGMRHSGGVATNDLTLKKRKITLKENKAINEAKTLSKKLLPPRVVTPCDGEFGQGTATLEKKETTPEKEAKRLAAEKERAISEDEKMCRDAEERAMAACMEGYLKSCLGKFANP
jgi:hypothetical protein